MRCLAGSNDEAVFALGFRCAKQRGGGHRRDRTRRPPRTPVQHRSDAAGGVLALPKPFAAHHPLGDRGPQKHRGSGRRRRTPDRLARQDGRNRRILYRAFRCWGAFEVWSGADLGVFPAVDQSHHGLARRTTATPDKTWSDWSTEVDASKSRASNVPDGRYLQARLTLRGNGPSTPLVHRLRISYLRQNLPPFVRDVTVLRRGLALLPVPQEDSKTKLVMVADKSDEGHAEELRRANGPQRARQVFEPGALTVKWISDDPNGDELRFDLSVKRLGEDHWQLVKQDLTEPFHTFDASPICRWLLHVPRAGHRSCR